MIGRDVGALLALAAIVTKRYLPRSAPSERDMHSGIESIENFAEPGLGGVPPVFDDDPSGAGLSDGHILVGSTQESR
jgi:hypothetical protein